MGQSQKLTGTGCRLVRHNTFPTCLMSVLQRECPSENDPYQIYRGHTVLVTDSITISTGNIGGKA